MLTRALAGVGLLVALPYVFVPIYSFPTPAPFTGSSLLNPYDQVHGSWQRANLHAHGRAWLGLTSGRQSNEEIVRRYRELGYTVPGVSNYHEIAANHGLRTLPIYEHGYNIGKHHQLGIGARSVDWFDLPIWQSRSHLQFIINRVAATSELVALVHPASRGAYSAEDVSALTGYHLIEVVNGKFTHDEVWDAALSSGRAVWAIANDDTHDLEDRERLGVAWTMIDAPSTSTADIVAALGAGRSYAVLRTNEGAKDTVLGRVGVNDGTLTVTAQGEPSTFDFVGQNGVVRKTVPDALTASYAFDKSDSYIRTIIRAPRTTMYLNPVVRHDGAGLPDGAASVDESRTWLLRAGFAAAAFGILIGYRRRRWRRCALTLPIVLVFAATPAFAQPPASPARPAPPAHSDPTLGSTYDADLLEDLPTSANLFAVLETMQPSLISDRFSSGGLYTGQPARIGGFLSSWTQTLYRIGDVNITNPTGSGTPLLVPDLMFWRRVDVATGLFGPEVNATGLAITLEPRPPTTTWTGRARGALSHLGLAGRTPSSPAPPVAQLDSWDHAAALVSGPLAADRLGVVVAASWTHGSQFDRGARVPFGRTLGSAITHLVFTPTDRDEVRTLGWLQRARYPFAYREAFGQPHASTTDTSAHVQMAWNRRAPDAASWQLYGGYTRRARASEYDRSTGASFERLIDGAVSELAWEAPDTTRQWSIGVKVEPSRTAFLRMAHTVQAGVEVGGSRQAVSEFFAGTVYERVDGRPARLWTFVDPGLGSRRTNVTIGLHVSDHVELSRWVTADVGLRFDSLSGSAGSSGNNVQWRTFMPRARIRWTVPTEGDAWRTTVFAGYGRSGYRLPLDFLAVGDPGASTADVYRWDMSAGAAPGAQRVARTGPGTGGDPAFSTIDRDLLRPIADELAIGIEVQPREGLRLGLTGLARRERNLIGLVNVGAPESAYSSMTIADPGADALSPDDDRLVTVYNRRPDSFGRDRYLLTNPAQEEATFNGLEITVRYAGERFLLFGGATASIAQASAASRGFGPIENDQSRLGELFTNPNAAVFARGRLFSDRAYTVKLASVYRFRDDVRLGVIARYQDGQPFSRLLVVPNLNQGVEAVRAFPNGDSRFTYTPSLDVRLQKRFLVRGRRLDAVVDAYNLLNLGKETEERTTSAPGVRIGSAIQPPRAIHVGFRAIF